MVTLGRWRVSPLLARYVTALGGYDIAARSEPHRGLPSTAVMVVLALDQPLDVGWWGTPGAVASEFAIASGLHMRPAAIGGLGPERGIQLALTALGSRALLGVPAAALAGQVVNLVDVAPHLAYLSERVAETAGSPERLRLVEDVLLAVARRGGGGSIRPDVATAMKELVGTGTVRGTADRLGWSRRHLSTLFTNELGLAPKRYQRIVRFEDARGRLTTPARLGRPSLAAVAAASGFADQAHLTREWTALAGCSPTVWLNAELGSAPLAMPQ